jgi:tetratricopeptide (TPR) repeat protein
VAVLAAGASAIYSRTFSVPFLLDDRASIPDNSTIRHLWPLGPAWSPPADAGVGGRPLLNFSYALNYAAGGPSLVGYHAVNLLIHVLAAAVLFALVRRTLRGPVLAPRFGSAATALALAIAAIWAWHPVQTEAVTYLTQRAESLMGLFFLVTVYAFARWAGGGSAVAAAAASSDPKPSRGGVGWAAVSVLACLGGVLTKEVMVTAPVLTFLYDRTFISGSFSAAWRRHWPVFLALAATWIPLGWLMTTLHERGMGFGAGISSWAYGITECRVVVKYLLLTVWPRPLVFDYGNFIPVPLSAVWPYAVILAAVLGAALVALARAPALGFAACWVLVILAPASSVVPIAGEPMAENRLYLSLAGVAAVAVLGGYALAGRRSWPLFAVIAAALGVAAFRRNLDYASADSIWRDTAAKSPANARAHNNLGNALLPLPGRQDEAIAEFETALRLQPDYAEAHSNLGTAWLRRPERLGDAIAQLQAALRLKPGDAAAHNDLGNAWLKLPGHQADAVAEFEAVLRLKPDDPVMHYNLGNAWLSAPGYLAEAIGEFSAAVRLKPDYAAAHYNLGSAWLKAPGHETEAIAQLQAALRLRPGDAEAHNNLGNAWLRLPGHTAEAAAEFAAAMELDPQDASAHYNLGNVWIGLPGRREDAIAQYEEALRLKPDYVAAHNNLGNAWLGAPGHLPDAIDQYEQTLRLDPAIAEAHNNLGIAWSQTPGRLSEATREYAAAIRLRPDYAEAHYNLGNAWYQTPGRMNDAIAEYEAALAANPRYAAAHFNLALALLNLPGRRAEAQAHLEEARRLQPHNAAAQRTLDEVREAPP